MKNKGRKRIHKFALDEVLPHIGKRQHVFWVKGKKYQIPLNNERMRLIGRSQVCRCCGLIGAYFWLERSGCRPPHFNLYAVKHQREVLMTMDHIIPKSKGGATVEENLQMLCCKCNHSKQNDNLTIEELQFRIARPQLIASQSNERMLLLQHAHDRYRDLLVQHGISTKQVKSKLVKVVELGECNARTQRHIDRNPNYKAFIQDATLLKSQLSESSNG